MKKSLLLLLVIICLGCEKDEIVLIPTQSPIPAGYPHVITSSPERVAALQARANLFATTFQVELTGFDTIRGVAKFNLGNGIILFPNAVDTISYAEAQESLLIFLGRWGDLFNIFSNQALLRSSYNSDTSCYEFLFEKSYSGDRNFNPYWGMLSIKITRFGILKQISSTCLPDNNIWPTPQVSLTRAMGIMKGKTYIFYCWMTDTIVFNPDIVQKAEIIRIAISRWDPVNYKLVSIEYRLCWKLQTPTYYIYVDAVAGEDIDYYEERFIC